jgi:glucosamine-6-phosphate deaminase
MDTDSNAWKLTVVPDAAAVSMAGADAIASVLSHKPDAVLSVPTGSTPLRMFDILSSRVARGEIDFSAVRIFCLDEYVGVAEDDPNSLTGWLWSAFLRRAGVRPEQVHALPALADDLDAASAAYERDLASHGGLDLAILGLGPNGHVAYNEPGSAADSRTRVVTLTPESLAQATAYWEGAVLTPGRALTMGVGTLLEAKRIVLIVTGVAKSDVLRRALEEPPSAEIPASWLRFAGSRLEVVADEAAASHLSK